MLDNKPDEANHFKQSGISSIGGQNYDAMQEYTKPMWTYINAIFQKLN